MKNIGIISLTKNTKELNDEIIKLLERHKYVGISYYGKKSASEVEHFSNLKDIKTWLEEYWKRLDAIVFIGAVDVAVRLIGTLIEDKMKDPAVLVIDEACKYVVPILGSHIGEGNDLSEKLAKIINAKDVITTPVEVQEKFKIEKFAELNNMSLENREQARTISTSVLEGQHIGFYCEYDIEGEIPSGLTTCGDKKELSWYTQRIAIRSEYIVGMGMKEGVVLSSMEDLFLSELDKLKIDMIQVKGIATIYEKREESALIALSEKYRIPILAYTTKELRELNLIHTSEMAVKSVANISERAALLGSNGGELVQDKVVGKGVTFAAARIAKTIYF